MKSEGRGSTDPPGGARESGAPCPPVDGLDEPHSARSASRAGHDICSSLMHAVSTSSFTSPSGQTAARISSLPAQFATALAEVRRAPGRRCASASSTRLRPQRTLCRSVSVLRWVRVRQVVWLHASSFAAGGVGPVAGCPTRELPACFRLRLLATAGRAWRREGFSQSLPAASLAAIVWWIRPSAGIPARRLVGLYAQNRLC